MAMNLDLPPIMKLGGLAGGNIIPGPEMATGTMDPRATMKYGAAPKKYGCQTCKDAMANPLGFAKTNWLPIAVIVALAAVVFLYVKKK